MSILRVDIVGNADKLNSSLKKAEKNLKKFGDKATAIGKDLSLKLTAPIGLAGAAAIKFATDTEESLNKVRLLLVTLANQLRILQIPLLRVLVLLEAQL